MQMDRTKRLYWFAASVIAVDRLITAVYWGKEANPLVTAMGQELWLAVTLALLAVLYPVTYLPFDPQQKQVVDTWLAFIGLIHLLIVKINFMVILGLI